MSMTNVLNFVARFAGIIECFLCELGLGRMLLWLVLGVVYLVLGLQTLRAYQCLPDNARSYENRYFIAKALRGILKTSWIGFLLAGVAAVLSGLC